MPIELGIWRIDGVLRRINPTRLEKERKLEDLIEKVPSLVDADILIIGRQVTTGFGKKIDIFSINADGELSVHLGRNELVNEIVETREG